MSRAFERRSSAPEARRAHRGPLQRRPPTARRCGRGRSDSFTFRWAATFDEVLVDPLNRQATVEPLRDHLVGASRRPSHVAGFGGSLTASARIAIWLSILPRSMPTCSMAARLLCALSASCDCGAMMPARTVAGRFISSIGRGSGWTGCWSRPRARPTCPWSPLRGCAGTGPASSRSGSPSRKSSICGSRTPTARAGTTRRFAEKGLDYPPGYARWSETRKLKAVLHLLAAQRVARSKA